ncbi:MAG TPA: glycosyltransferase family 39 protein [Candidatus Ozemobacteraceae bacterium]|nr:glycosyltransferase family 39 protein [Candidatus Ozemobacteraceae bacterium]
MSTSSVSLPLPDAVPPATQDRLWEQRFWLFLTFFWLVRLAMGLLLDLTPDEAYYWELARRPDWSYFDHPPLVAWMIAAFRHLLGDTPLAVRLPVLITLPIVCRALYLIGRDALNNPAAGFLGSLLVHLTPAGMALGLITTPDTPLALFWSLGAVAFLAALRTDAVSCWVATGVCLALGALGKYNMIFFVPAVAVVILAFPAYRSRLTTGRLWLMVALAAIGTLPILYWNSLHDWASFRFQFAHGFKPSPKHILSNIGEFLGGQLGTIGPLLYPVFWWVALRGLADGWRRSEAGRLFLALLALPMMLFFVRRGLSSKVEANWPQIAYLSLMPLAAEWLLAAQAARRSRLLWIVGPSALLTLIVALQAMTLILPLPSRADISIRLHGWQALGAKVREIDAATGHSSLFVGQGGPLTALISFYGNLPPDRIAEVHGKGNWRFWWAGREPASGSNAVFIDDGRYSEALGFGRAYTSILASETLPVVSRGRLIRTLTFTPLHGYRGGVRFEMGPTESRHPGAAGPLPASGKSSRQEDPN